MALLPERNILDGTKTPATTTSDAKTAFGLFRDFLSDLLGTDSSNKAAARTALGATTIGQAIFTASDAASARTALAIPITATYDSGDQTITAAGAATLPHGLGVKPKLVMVFLKCISSELGYAVNDELPISIGCEFDGTNSRGVQVKHDATNIIYFIGNCVNSFALIDTSIKGASGITNSKWKLIIRAYA